jgi:acyl carrier protein
METEVNQKLASSKAQATVMSVKAMIMGQIEQIAREHGKALAPLSDELVLVESGLDSLGFAVLVARLESNLGIDPFTAAEDALFPVTLGEFVRAYEQGAARSASTTGL